jgi:hypothetical protein
MARLEMWSHSHVSGMKVPEPLQSRSRYIMTPRYLEYYGIPEAKMNNGTPVIDFASTEEHIIPTKNQAVFKATLAEQRQMIRKLKGTGSSSRRTKKASSH